MTSIISDLLEFTQTSFHSLEVTRSYFVDIVDVKNMNRERLIHFGFLPMTQTILDSARLKRTQFDSLEHH